MIGRTLAHYDIVEKIGAGGMGEVYRARDTKLGRDVALKVLPAATAADPERRKRFEREARAIAALKHPNIVTIYSVEEAEGTHFITMEFVEGQTLSELIPDEGLGLDRFFAYAIPLAEAVATAHVQSITHRDLKPANVMIDKDGRLKVLDFGLAKLLAPDSSSEQAETAVGISDTGVGQIMGTAAYMSPEQAEGKPIDQRSDIFSLGIVLYEMATGDRPFKGDTHISTISSILKDSPRHLSEIKQSIPRHLGRIVNHCLEKSPDKRFQSAQDIRNELEGLKQEIDSGDLTATLTDVQPAARATGGSSRRWLLPAAVTVIAVVAVIAVFLSRSGEETARVGVTEHDTGASAPEASTAPGEQVGRKMTVVFPFDNLGPAEDAYFAAGMSEEITSRLAAVSGLGVISRTSAVQYDRTGKTMKDIGEDLGVDFVLEGTVRWAKRADGTDRVRITPQLIRVADDTHVWSETYDRDIKDIFAVQTDIATRVIEQLDVTLLGPERTRIENAPTASVTAYRLYLQANDLQPGEFANYGDWDARRIELFEQAIEQDPEFVEARAQLSRHHSSMYNGFDRTEDRLSQARAAMQEAIRIDPEHHASRLARGYYRYYGFREYDAALEDFETAARLVPNDAEATEAIGYIYRRQGRWDESNEALKRAMELNPQDPRIANNLAQTYRGMRRFSEAIRAIDRAITIAPGNPEYKMTKALMYIELKGDMDTARELMTHDVTGNPMFYHLGWFTIHSIDGNHDMAIEAATSIPGKGPVFDALRTFLTATATYASRGPDGASDAINDAIEVINGILEVAPGNAFIRQWLATGHALQGDADAAVREARLAGDLTAKDQFAGPGALETLAFVYAMTDREDEAIDLIERLLKTVYESSITTHDLRMDPRWEPLRDHPRLQALLAESS